MDISVHEVEQFLYREARMLDDRDFEGWLNCYAPDAEFWMPAWDDDDTLVTDPQQEISLIWYGNRAGLYYSCCFPVCDRAAAQRGSVVGRDGYVVSPPSGRRGSGGEGCEAGAVVMPAGAGLMPSAPC